jgi:uncharacterized protein YifE (UPF0438 family)
MSFATSKRFFDNDNFPHGFSRSGDFTRAQALILETKGVALKALHEGHQPPQTDEEKRFVAMCLEQQPPTTDVEKAWSVYLKVLKRKKVYFTASTGSTESGSNDTLGADVE